MKDRSLHACYPAAEWLLTRMGKDPERLRRKFIEAHNRKIYARTYQLPANQILLLLPHCLQWDQCPLRITREAQRCARCGHCQISELLELQERLGFSICVATGGTLARQAIVKRRPQAVVAVACERDLVAGILDIRHLPVLGILNERPQGPCLNTKVPVEAIRQAFDFFQGGSVCTATTPRPL